MVDGNNLTVVGVVGDYLLGSSKGTVPPMMFFIDEQGFRTLALRFKTNDVAKLLADIDATWTEVIGERPIRRQFMDDRIAALYQTEEQQGQIFALFSGLAILVSCIGLYGLVSFSVARRQREIGVRKILGATNGVITRQILWDFSKPVLVANLMAWPLTAYLMSDWLTNFNYRIDLGPTPFVAAAMAALVVAGLTVISHAIRVASANPIHALRHE
jgi:putative ABC transport system permease protein